MDLIFATNNFHKLKEVQNLIGSEFNIFSLKDIDFVGEIPEEQDTIEGNASQKAHYIYNHLADNSSNVNIQMRSGKTATKAQSHKPAWPVGRETRKNQALSRFLEVPLNNLACIADDTGLEIEALNGRPGVYSARYAGGGCSFDDNMNKVLEEMEDILERSAKFKTVISLIIEGEEKQFEGLIGGQILKEKRGERGFGYDAIFQPDGYTISFAEMQMKEKNEISHRGIAVKKLANYLNKLT